MLLLSFDRVVMKQVEDSTKLLVLTSWKILSTEVSITILMYRYQQLSCSLCLTPWGQTKYITLYNFGLIWIWRHTSIIEILNNQDG